MTGKAYISYSRRSENSFKDRLRTAVSDSDVPWEICFDETALGIERSIGAFTQELSDADQIIFLLSAGYFQSHYCIDELVASHTKRAKDLLPIIVFTRDFQPDHLKPDDVIQQWEARCPEISLALTWLLGKYDPQKNNWDTLFPVERDSGEETVQQVIELLEEKRIPSFRYFSVNDKQQQITQKVKKVLTHELMDRGLREKLNEFLETPTTGRLLKQLLVELDRWLKALEAGEHSLDQRRRLVIDIKALTGCLVLSAVDDAALLHTIHQLNRAREDARLEIKQKSDSSFQMVVSAIANTPALFRYIPPSQAGNGHEHFALQGEGELVLHERGLCKENYYNTVADEAKWLECYRVLAKQMAARCGDSPGEYDDLDVVSDAIEGFLWGRGDYYLLFDQGLLKTHRASEFQRALHERFRSEDYSPVLQVISDSREDHSVEKYLIRGLGSGFLNQKLISIYSTFHRLSHDSKDNP